MSRNEWQVRQPDIRRHREPTMLIALMFACLSVLVYKEMKRYAQDFD